MITSRYSAGILRKGSFQEVRGQYSMAWLLVAAQAYQESQIDQAKKNPTGAVGIMQIKPSTAADDPTLITGVDVSYRLITEAQATREEVKSSVAQ